MEEVNQDFYSHLFDSYDQLPHAIFRRMGESCPLSSVPRSTCRHIVVRASGPDSIRPKQMKKLTLVPSTPWRKLFTYYLLECRFHLTISRIVLVGEKGSVHDKGSYRPICILSVVYKLSTRVILNKATRMLDEG